MDTATRWTGWIEALLGLAIGAYLVAGIYSVAFHADEAGHIHASRLTMERIAEGDLEALTRVADANWPDFNLHEAVLALTVAPFHTYVMGGALYAAGLREPDTGRGWTFEVDYAENVQRGHRPAARWLNIARLTSTLLLFFSVFALYGLARTVAGRGVAIGASLLYASSPLILLHGRRAMLEGPFLFFTLLTLLLAAVMVGRPRQGKAISAADWISLSLASGLCVATKHTGVVFVAAAFAWVGLSQWISETGRARSRFIAHLAGAGFLAIAVFGMLSPVLWTHPVERVMDMGRVRVNILDVQVHNHGGRRVRSTGERLEALVRAPYLTPIQSGTVPAEDRRYMASFWPGVRLPAPIAWLATLLAGLGLATAIQRALRVGEREHLYWGVLVWTLASVGLALVDPLAWQRYLVPSLPLAYFLTALGVSGVLEWSRFLRGRRT